MTLIISIFVVILVLLLLRYSGDAEFKDTPFDVLVISCAVCSLILTAFILDIATIIHFL